MMNIYYLKRKKIYSSGPVKSSSSALKGIFFALQNPLARMKSIHPIDFPDLLLQGIKLVTLVV